MEPCPRPLLMFGRRAWYPLFTHASNKIFWTRVHTHGKIYGVEISLSIQCTLEIGEAYGLLNQVWSMIELRAAVRFLTMVENGQSKTRPMIVPLQQPLPRQHIKARF